MKTKILRRIFSTTPKKIEGCVETTIGTDKCKHCLLDELTQLTNSFDAVMLVHSLQAQQTAIINITEKLE